MNDLGYESDEEEELAWAAYVQRVIDLAPDLALTEDEASTIANELYTYDVYRYTKDLDEAGVVDVAKQLGFR